MDIEKRAERGRKFAKEHDMTPEEALGFILDKSGLEGDSPAPGEAGSCTLLDRGTSTK